MTLPSASPSLALLGAFMLAPLAPAIAAPPASTVKAGASQAGALAFPGAVGWAATTPGGRGGRIIRVTTLAPDGPGSFKAALEAKGPRIIVFEVGGIIDLGRETLKITEPYVTIAGQTAPSPGITLIKTGIDIATHDVVMRHIRIRTGVDGQPKLSGWEADALSTVAAHNIIIDHCSFTWAIDENMSASGPRFDGKTPDDWRASTSHAITFSYNIAAEGLADASHPKGEHSKGTLIHDNASQIMIWRNIYAHNKERNPLVKGGGQVELVNNILYDPGERAVHYNLMALEWGDHPYQTGKIAAVGNVLRGGVSTAPGMPFLTLGGDGDLDYHGKDNIAVDRFGVALPMFGRYGETRAKLNELPAPPVWWPGTQVLPARDVETHVLGHAGARPWDRDADDLRVLFFVAEGRGEIIDDEKQVGGYPKMAQTRAPFVEADWNLDTMEPKSGRYPGQKAEIAEHLSDRDKMMRQGEAGEKK
ncbi:pectate lyase [Sphingobium sp. Leaf26]|uniref:pectate lyase family protein n=1 Tax=Sphingobium sp. Leaf26 TaxID=1735693 RepID=UPI0006F5E55D|nr:pectate lyase [Sphingobium sp. Leaf26]KQN04189.1 pectate lyase [Sphingobium sp. Leaf26]